MLVHQRVDGFRKALRSLGGHGESSATASMMTCWSVRMHLRILSAPTAVQVGSIVAVNVSTWAWNLQLRVAVPEQDTGRQDSTQPQLQRNRKDFDKNKN